MSTLSSEMLEILLEADPFMDIVMTEENKILLDFTPETNVCIVLNCSIKNPVNRVIKAMEEVANKLSFSKSSLETASVYGGLRKVLGKERMCRLECLLLRSYY